MRLDSTSPIILLVLVLFANTSQAEFPGVPATVPERRAFGGLPVEGESGLVAMGARHYDPAAGRFLQTDPLGAVADQLYAYGANNPYLYWDPTGFAPEGINIDAFRQNYANLSESGDLSRFDRFVGALFTTLMDGLYERSSTRTSEISLCGLWGGCADVATRSQGGWDVGPFANVFGIEETSINGGPYGQANGNAEVFGEIFGPGKVPLRGVRYSITGKRLVEIPDRALDMTVIMTNDLIHQQMIWREFVLAVRQHRRTSKIYDPVIQSLVAQRLAAESFNAGAAFTSVYDLPRVPAKTSLGWRELRRLRYGTLLHDWPPMPPRPTR